MGLFWSLARDGEWITSRARCGAEAYEFEIVEVRLAVDQNQVGLEVAIAVIMPLTGQRMIEVSMRQRVVGCQ